MSSDLRLYLFLGAFLTIIWSMRRAAGRLAPRVAIAPIVFLLTRRAVLIGWVLGAIGMFALLVTSAEANGKDAMAKPFLLMGISVFCGLGVAALVVGPLFALTRLFTPRPVFELEPGESVLEQRPANHFLGGEARGGKLLVTTRRLGFAPHRFNVQSSPWSVRLEDVRALDVEGERFLVVGTNSDSTPQWLVSSKPGELAAQITRIAARPERDRSKSHSSPSP